MTGRRADAQPDDADGARNPAHDTATLVVANDVVWEVSRSGSAVHALLAPDGEVLVLEGTAAMVWEAVALGLDPVAEVSAATGADPVEVEAGTLAFVDHLCTLGLLTRQPADPAPRRALRDDR